MINFSYVNDFLFFENNEKGQFLFPFRRDVAWLVSYFFLLRFPVFECWKNRLAADNCNERHRCVIGNVQCRHCRTAWKRHFITRLGTYRVFRTTILIVICWLKRLKSRGVTVDSFCFVIAPGCKLCITLINRHPELCKGMTRLRNLISSYSGWRTVLRHQRSPPSVVPYCNVQEVIQFQGGVRIFKLFHK